MKAGSRSLQRAGFLDSAQELLEACRCLLQLPPVLRLMTHACIAAGTSHCLHCPGGCPGGMSCIINGQMTHLDNAAISCFSLI